MQKDYIHPEWRNVLVKNGLSSFDAFWNLPMLWVEPPNAERGGASGASRLELDASDQVKRIVYLKRQSGHARRSLRHPIWGEPTFARENAMLLHLRDNGIGAPLPVFYGEKVVDGRLCAILALEKLEGYLPLDEYISTLANLPETLIVAVAKVVRAMHDLGVQHRSLYPKHIFVKENPTGYDVSLIDLEKSRKVGFPSWSAVLDLSTLDYRGPGWRESDRARFFKQYHGVDALNWWQKLQGYLINKRSKNRLKKVKKT